MEKSNILELSLSKNGMVNLKINGPMSEILSGLLNVIVKIINDGAGVSRDLWAATFLYTYIDEFADIDFDALK